MITRSLICPDCHVPIKEARLASHQAERCPLRKSVRSPANKSGRAIKPVYVQRAQPAKRMESVSCSLSPSDRRYADQSNKFRCFDCQNWIPAAHRRIHYEDHRFGEKKLQSADKIAANWRGCLHCSDLFESAEEMRHHLSSLHPRAQHSARNIEGRSMSSLQVRWSPALCDRVPTFQRIVRDDPARDLKAGAEPKQRPSLDMTVRYAHAHREGGKFGSASTEDDYGEEANL